MLPSFVPSVFCHGIHHIIDLPPAEDADVELSSCSVERTGGADHSHQAQPPTVATHRSLPMVSSDVYGLFRIEGLQLPTIIYEARARVLLFIISARLLWNRKFTLNDCTISVTSITKYCYNYMELEKCRCSVKSRLD